ncbi:DUF4102 domain-containing protein [Nostoc sp. 'Peltigera membranacea cyanobiont' 232]|uniref:DUF4102 domain-containing protein n=1 Tax=Nostoc sp. 'Peltigera membranacea cyanobiont' 232 TaxID=2014531 RepID=UPI0016730383|nr:DUF4102 domain-containing protein [Nostoc sp. 'Peltigera membranacea cyanobiont' 232]
MKHNSDVPGQLALFAIAPSEAKIAIHDPYWDELEVAPQQLESARWNPAHFGEVAHQVDSDGQLTIFYDSPEPPDPDDYKNLDEYQQAWGQWELRVGGQVSKATFGDTAESLVGEQVATDTQKTAPQHDTHWVERYWVERSGNKYWYYRYCWMNGRKIYRCYLGSVHSRKALQKKADVEVWIADGYSPMEIQKLIHDSYS